MRHAVADSNASMYAAMRVRNDSSASAARDVNGTRGARAAAQHASA